MTDDLRYPLTWPTGFPKSKHHRRSPFRNTSIDRCRNELIDELGRLRASRIVLSTNLKLRLDGYPYASAEGDVRRKRLSPGVAVYFKLKGRDIALACDAWDLIADNLRALTKHIEALRGQERWGVGNVEQAFAVYQALPAPEPNALDHHRPWWKVLGWDEEPDHFTGAELKMRYRARSLDVHPDRPSGSHIAFKELNEAKQIAEEMTA